MSLPIPLPGLVIRYSYLWADDAATGHEDGVKDRPSVIVMAVGANSWAAAIVATVILVLAMLFAMLVHSALSAIYSAALYRYATGTDSTGAFSAPMLHSAFAPK